ncbi:hypothetical protein WJX79_000529 [Trebouxia sp. C0005]
MLVNRFAQSVHMVCAAQRLPIRQEKTGCDKQLLQEAFTTFPSRATGPSACRRSIKHHGGWTAQSTMGDLDPTR